MDYMTEDEAKTTICHLSLAPMINSNDEIIFNPATCIGSACMAWRNGHKRNPDWKPRHGMMSTGFEQHPDDEARPYIADPETGFCGLAGRPS